MTRAGAIAARVTLWLGAWAALTGPGLGCGGGGAGGSGGGGSGGGGAKDAGMVGGAGGAVNLGGASGSGGAGRGGGSGSGGSSGTGGGGGGGAAGAADANDTRDVPGSGGAGPAKDGGGDASVARKTFVYVSGFSPLISVHTFDPVAGTVTRTSMVTTAADGEPSFLAVSPDKRFLYANDEQNGKPLSRVIAYRIDQNTGALQEINRESTRTSVSAHVAVHRSGKWVLSANYGGGNVSVFPVRDDGGLAPSATPVAAGGKAHQIVFDSTGTVLFVPCLDAGYVAVYRFADGVLTPHDPPTVAITGGPRSITFPPGERHAYVLTQDESTITAFSYDAGTARLTPIETVPSTPAGSFSGNIEVHPLGKFLYTTNRRDNSVAMFRVDATTGKLTLIGHQRAMLTFPRMFGIDPSGQFMLIASQNTATLLVHRIDQNAGTLQAVGAPVSVPPSPTFVGVLTIP